MSKYVYNGPSDTFIYGDTKLDKDKTAQSLPDAIVEKYSGAGHFFTKVSDAVPATKSEVK